MYNVHVHVSPRDQSYMDVMWQSKLCRRKVATFHVLVDSTFKYLVYRLSCIRHLMIPSRKKDILRRICVARSRLVRRGERRHSVYLPVVRYCPSSVSHVVKVTCTCSISFTTLAKVKVVLRNCHNYICILHGKQTADGTPQKPISLIFGTLPHSVCSPLVSPGNR